MQQLCSAFFNPFPLSQDYGFMICYYYVKGLGLPLFRTPKGQRSWPLGQKRSFSVKSELLPQFLSQGFEIFRMWRSLYDKKIVCCRILIQGSKIFQKIFENGQNFELFYYSSQDLQITVVNRFWDPEYISFGIFAIGSKMNF